MRLSLRLCICGGILGTILGNARVAISAVTVDATEANRAGGMHGGAVGRGVASKAASGLLVGVSLRLQEQNTFVALRMSRTCAMGSYQAEQARRDERAK